jgi:2-phospho-L-lactate guanylyltransferase
MIGSEWLQKKTILRTSNKQNNIWVIVPVKPLTHAKSRLAKVLSQNERQALASKLLRHTLATLAKAFNQEIIAGYVVISRDNSVLALAKENKAIPLLENTNSSNNLNTALSQATRHLQTVCNDWVLLILPTDLPFLSLEDLTTVIEQSYNFEKGAIIVPDRYHDGTNLLLLKPYNLLDFRYYFGDKSFTKHIEALQQEGITPTIIQNANLAFDLDLPEDLLQLDKKFY